MRRLISQACVMAIAGLLLAVQPADATSGWLDPSFSGDGHRRVDPGDPEPPSFHGSLVIEDGPSGRIFLGRYTFISDSSSFAFLALTPSGAIDTAFGGGTWRGSLGDTDHNSPMAMLPTSNGGVIGASWAGFVDEMHLGRLGPGGGTTHHVILGLSDDQVSNAVGLPTESLRACGYSDTTNPPSRLVALTSTFQQEAGAHGNVLDIASCSETAADAAGNLYFANQRLADPIGGDTRREFDLLRTSSSGATDAAWGESGHAVVGRGGLHVWTARHAAPGAAAGYSTALPTLFPQPDGSVLIAGWIARVDPAGSSKAAVIKVTPAGELDPTFGTGGIKAMGPADGRSRIIAMAVDSQGRPIVSLVYNFNDGRTRAYLARLTTTGQFDSSFGRSGLIQQTYGATAISFDAAGRIMTMAWAGDTLIVARRLN